MTKKYDYIREGLTDNSFRPLLWVIVTGVIALLSSVLYSLNYFTVLSVNENLTELGADVFLKYLFIVVAVERAAAVLVGISYSRNRVDWTLRINRIGEILQKENPSIAVLKHVYTRENRLVKELERADIIGEIEDVPSSPTKNDYLGFLTSAKQAYEFQRARFNSIRNRNVARMVLIGGVFLAILGLSIFQDLFQNMNLVSMMKDQIASGEMSKAGILWQTRLLRFADIVVTGGLLGGGSAGLNAIATKLSEFVNKP